MAPVIPVASASPDFPFSIFFLAVTPLRQLCRPLFSPLRQKLPLYSQQASRSPPPSYLLGSCLILHSPQALLFHKHHGCRAAAGNQHYWRIHGCMGETAKQFEETRAGLSSFFFLTASGDTQQATLLGNSSTRNRNDIVLTKAKKRKKEKLLCNAEAETTSIMIKFASSWRKQQPGVRQTPPEKSSTTIFCLSNNALAERRTIPAPWVV
eukprot:IDg11056t1